MPWLLDTQLSMGDISSDVISEVRIVRQSHDSVRKFIRIIIQFGKTDVNGDWQAMRTPDNMSSILILEGDDYTSFIAANQTVYNSVKTVLYDKLLLDGVIPMGSVS